VTSARLRRLCLALPGAEEVVQWGGVHVFKAGGRMFATLSPEGGALRHVAFKASPESFHVLTEAGSFMPAPYLARAQWVATDDLDALTDAEWRGYLVRAWRLVVLRLPKRLRAPLLAAADAGRMRA
jgi:predicted DNA-binding protein (MmcQ/YjbR family)